MGGLVSFDIAEGNLGALTFIMGAYSDGNCFKAERGFARMRDNGITGSKLYMLWNDCCDRNTDMAVEIMCDREIKEIIEHINYENGRGIPFVKNKERED